MSTIDGCYVGAPGQLPAFVADDGTVFFPASVFMEPDVGLMCAAADGVPFFVEESNKELYLPATWIAKELPMMSDAILDAEAASKAALGMFPVEKEAGDGGSE